MLSHHGRNQENITPAFCKSQRTYLLCIGISYCSYHYLLPCCSICANQVLPYILMFQEKREIYILMWKHPIFKCWWIIWNWLIIFSAMCDATEELKGITIHLIFRSLLVTCLSTPNYGPIHKDFMASYIRPLLYSTSHWFMIFFPI